MTVDKYVFWAQIGVIANNLNSINEIRECNWLENFAFKENLSDDIQIIDNLLENKNESKIKLRER